jgi:hypothetical protein
MSVPRRAFLLGALAGPVVAASRALGQDPTPTSGPGTGRPTSTATAAQAPGPLSADDADLLSRLLVLEHAAVHAYGRLGPLLADPLRVLARRLADIHQLQRDTLRSALVTGGAEAPPPEPVYALPLPARTPGSALAAAVAVEERTLDGYHAALPRLGEKRLRGMVGSLLVQCATNRAELGVDPVSVAFPGRDG